MDDGWEPHTQEVFMRTEVFIGVDISKPRLDVFNLATGELLEFANSPAGIQAFVKYAKKAKLTSCSVHRGVFSYSSRAILR